MEKTGLVALFLFLAVSASFASAQDAVMVDPEHHKVEFENDQIRVVRMVYPAGYKTPMHGHLPGVTVFLSETSVHSWSKSGEESDTQTEFGTVSWSEGTSIHANEVRSDSPLELVRVEIKKKGATPIPTPSHDAAKVDPEHHEVEFENDQVRVIRATYPPGYEAPLHNHLPGIGITLADRQYQAMFESGETSSGELVKKGTVSDFSAGSEPHKTKNIGSSTGEAIRVELKTKL